MWKTLGQDAAISMFRAANSEQRLAHSYLFVGPKGVGKTTLAEDFARFLFCENENAPCGTCSQCMRVTSKIHTDLYWIGSGLEEELFSKNRSIGIDRIREIRSVINIKPFEGLHRIVIISRAEDMTLQASNALLKVLEEPPKNVFFLLLTSNISLILPTIISRCQLLKIRGVSDEAIRDLIVDRFNFDNDFALDIARLSAGKVGMAISMAQNPEYLERRLEIFASIEAILNSSLDKRFEYAQKLAREFSNDPEKVQNELSMWEVWWRDLMLVKFENPELIYNFSKFDYFRELQSTIDIHEIINLLKTIHVSMDLLQKNVNPRLVLDQLVLDTPIMTSR